MPVEVSTGWKLQEAGKVTGSGELVSTGKYKPSDWHAATVPGDGVDEPGE